MSLSPSELPQTAADPGKAPSWRLKVLRAAVKIWPIVEPYLLKWLADRAAARAAGQPLP